MISKKILLIGALLGGAGLIYSGRNKAGELNSLKNNLQVDLKKTKLKSFSGGNIDLSVDVEITNPTAAGFDIPSNLVTIKALKFYTKTKKYLGVADTNITNLSIPANSTRVVTDIPVTIPIMSLANSLSEVLDIISDSKNLVVTADVNALGFDFTV